MTEQETLNEIHIIKSFLEKLPNYSLLEIWNEYQSDLFPKHNYVYEMRYFENVVEHETNDVIKSMRGFNYNDDYFIIKDGTFTSSNFVKELISIEELIEYYCKS